MKKILAIGALLLAGTVGAFALDLGSVKGTWKDAKWDANWTFGADGKIALTKASTGEAVYTFTDKNVQNFKINANTSGVSISFSCKDTERSYTFKKGVALSADLEMTVNPDWTDEDYNTTIKFQK